MNHDEKPNDSVLTQELRDAVSELATRERPPLSAITSRGQAHRRRRLAGLSGLGVTVAVACTALVLGLTAALGGAPARSTGRSTGRIQAAPPVTSTATFETAAFTLTSNANGTDTLTLPMSQMLDPAALQRALAQHGIPALVKVGAYCVSSPPPPDPVSAGVLSIWPPLTPPRRVTAPSLNHLTPGEANRIGARSMTVINPAAIPSGTELFFGYFNNVHAVFTDLIYTSSYTCSNGQP
jgi:hypothetical protein